MNDHGSLHDHCISLVQFARNANDREDYVTCLKYATAALALESYHEAHYLCGKVYEEQGDSKRAVEELTLAIDESLGHDYWSYYNCRGLVRVSMGIFKDAQTDYLTAIAKGASMVVTMNLIQALLLSGDLEGALNRTKDTLARITITMDVDLSPKYRYTTLLYKGIAQLRMGQYSDAKNSFESMLLQAKTMDETCIALIAVTWYFFGDESAARNTLETVGLYPESLRLVLHPYKRLLHSVYSQMVKDWSGVDIPRDESPDTWKLVDKKEKQVLLQEVSNLWDTANSYIAAEDYKTAISITTKVIQLSPKEMRKRGTASACTAYGLRAIAYAETENFTAALKDLKASDQWIGETALTDKCRAVVYERMNDHTMAICCYEHALGQLYKHDLGQLYEHDLGQLKSYKDTADTVTWDMVFRTALASSYLITKQPYRAFKTLNNLNPNLDVHFFRGVAYLNLGVGNKAILEFESANKFAKSNNGISPELLLIFLSVAYFQVGRDDQPPLTEAKVERTSLLTTYKSYVVLAPDAIDAYLKKQRIPIYTRDKVLDMIPIHGIKPEVMPMSDAETDGKKQKPLNMHCVVCMENPKEYAIMMCGHFCLCQTCVPKIEKTGKCPMCRQRIDKIVKLFF